LGAKDVKALHVLYRNLVQTLEYLRVTEATGDLIEAFQRAKVISTNLAMFLSISFFVQLPIPRELSQKGI
jgi:hypothetical protein